MRNCSHTKVSSRSKESSPASRKTAAMLAAEFNAVFASRELTLPPDMIMCNLGCTWLARRSRRRLKAARLRATRGVKGEGGVSKGTS